MIVKEIGLIEFSLIMQIVISVVGEAGACWAFRKESDFRF